MTFLNDNYLSYFLNTKYSYFRNYNNKIEPINWSDASNSEKEKMAINAGLIDHSSIMSSSADLEI